MANNVLTSVNVAIQTLNQTAFKAHKIFMTLDPAFNIAGFSRFFLEGKIRKISFGINEHIGVCELNYINRPFGSRIGSFVLPVAVYIDNADNFVYRGFFCDEEGTLSTSSDEVTATCYDYKWLIGKFSKIRGQIYTVDNNIYPEFTPGDPTVFGDESLYEKFRYVIPGLNKQGEDLQRGAFSQTVASIYGTGFLGGLPTVFNRHGNPDCSADTPYKNVAFMYDSDISYFRGIPASRRSTTRYFWNYASMLRYVCTNYITNVFSGTANTTKVLINETSLSNILRYGEKYGMDIIRPVNFDITNKSPMEAVDHIVKHIPGSWYWRLLYFPHSVLIDIQNHSDPDFALPGKKIYVGNYGKLNNKTNNQTNVVSAKVKYSAKNAISHAVVSGGPISIETTVCYLPGWPQYIRPVSDLSGGTVADFGDEVETEWDGVSDIPSGYYLSDFKGIKDWEYWRQYQNSDIRNNDADSKKLRELISADDMIRYSKIYRVYTFPENQQQIARFPDSYINTLLSGYENLATYVDQLFYRYILRPRKIRGPVTQYRSIFQYAKFTDNYNDANLKRELKEKHHDDPPFVFLYDELLGTTTFAEINAATQSNPNILPKLQAVLKAKKWILPQEEKSNSYQFENENKVIIFQQPQFERRTLSHDKNERQESIPPFDLATSRAVFVTCRIECDVPLIKDRIANKIAYSNASLVTQEINTDLEACIRINAFFPNPSAFIGNDLNAALLSDSDITKTIDDLGASSGNDQTYSKLVNWNRYLYGDNAPAGILAVDDTNYIDQILQFIIDDAPLYEITGDADLGVIDTGYTVGDKLDDIVNSQLSDGSGGYFKMDCVIDKLEYSAAGEKDDTYTTKINWKNKFPIVQYLRNKHKIGRHK